MNEDFVNRALRWLTRAIVITSLGAAGVVLWPDTDVTPATPAEKAAAMTKIHCPSDDICQAVLLPPTGQCGALVHQDGKDPTMTGTGDCPGDVGFSISSVPVGQRLRRLLTCGKRDGAMIEWVSHWAPAGPPNCGVLLMFTRRQARAWVERLDASQSTALVSARLQDMPTALKRGGGRWMTWAGMEPTNDEDASGNLSDESVDAGQ